MRVRRVRDGEARVEKKRDASAGTNITDVMHVTSEQNGKLKLNELPPSPDKGGGVGVGEGGGRSGGRSPREALLEMDAMATPIQSAARASRLWRGFVWVPLARQAMSSVIAEHSTAAACNGSTLHTRSGKTATRVAVVIMA